MCTKETHTVDYQIKTNIGINTNHNKKQLFLLGCFIICIICTFVSCVIIYILNLKIVEIQMHINILNNTILSLNEKCNTQYHLNNYASNSYLKSNSSVESFEESTTAETIYDYDTLDEVVDNEEMNLRNQRAVKGDRYNRDRAKGAATRQVKEEKKNSSYKYLLAVHFKGSIPEIQLNNQGLIGPWWYDDIMGSNVYKFSKFHLTEGKSSIEITEPALYFIYAQIYYYTTSPKNSYSLCVRSEGSSVEHVIARCSAVGLNNSQASEISCFTAGVKILKKNDRVYLKQTEKNRMIILRDGYSFFGFVRLNNSRRMK